MIKHLKRFFVVAIVCVVLLTTVADAGQKRPVIGVCIPTMTNIFWNRYHDFMQQGAKELGCDLIVVNANDKPDQLLKGLEDLVAQGVDGIIYVPYYESAGRALKLSAESGVPIAFTDCFADVPPQAPGYPTYIAYVGPNDAVAGYQMAKYLFDKMPLDKDGQKKIAVLNGTPGATVAIGRRKGLDVALAENPEVVIVGEVSGNFLRDEALAKFESLYQGHPEIAGVWSANDEMVYGAKFALNNHGKVAGKDVILTGIDLNEPNIELIQTGEQALSLGGHWLQGGFALVLMYDNLMGIPVPQDKSNHVLELLPVTNDLVGEYRKDFPGGQPRNFKWKEYSRFHNPNAQPYIPELKYTDVNPKLATYPTK